MTAKRQVSVITPCYNAEAFAGQTIQSVLDQSYDDVEHIIVDDGSEDASCDVVESFGDQVCLVRQENSGAAAARRRGVAVASGDYFMFLDADDLIGEKTIESLVRVLPSDEKKVSACPWKRLVREGGTWVEEETDIPQFPPTDDYLESWIGDWYIPTCSLLWTRKAYQETNGWDERVSENDDGDLMMRALIRGVRVVHADTGHSFYRDHGTARNSLSNPHSLEAVLSSARIMKKIEKLLCSRSKLDAYALAIGQEYYNLARRVATMDENLCERYYNRAIALAGRKAVSGSLPHRVLSSILGLVTKEKLAEKLAQGGIMRTSRRSYRRMRKLSS